MTDKGWYRITFTNSRFEFVCVHRWLEKCGCLCPGNNFFFYFTAAHPCLPACPGCRSLSLRPTG